ncbi:SDR family NAD(P)-dependent oxidoreductase [Wenxinia marina]|uniref:Short-chain dehydrogenase n=1 Tax=Wenxinia marina DSM 24838 TaxID=1123501 RepID=A0A0D0Q906_9RHOB|nr:SDR family oxidoreductase [Wenxinia marina]KIQ70899.1 Short-chain dehydrogenase [Wenxinia marina DSM 24838]GGL56426.1 hypothetical protein GCM10011392_08630 [Wenxinia marina]
MTDLTDGIAIVTGAGRGLGRALALELARRGVRVGALGRDPAALDALAGESEGILPLIADVADPAAVAAAFAQARAHGPVRILVNNAAAYPRRDILDESADSFMATVATNLGGTVACTREALADMTDAGVGRILNVATFADVAPLPASAAYAVSKGAARIFTRALVADLGDRFPGIVVSDWMPGMLATSMGIADGLDPAIAARWGAALALWHDRSLNGTVWEMDRELPPPRSLKRRLADRVTLRRVEARRL